METAEEYWTDEFWQYAQQVKHDLELAAEAKNSADQENNTI